MHLTIARKILILMCLFYLCLGLVGGASMMGIEEVGSNSQQVAQRLQMSQQLHHLESRVLRVQASAQAWQLDPAANRLQNLRFEVRAAQDVWREVSDLNWAITQTELRQIRSHLEAIDRGLRGIDSRLRAPEAMHGNGGTARADLLAWVSERAIELENEAHSAVEMMERHTRTLLAEPYQQQASTLAAIALLSVGVALLAGLGGTMMGRGISLSLRRLTELARRLATMQGDLTQRVEVRSHDEAGELAEAFNTMLETLSTLLTKVNGAGDGVADLAEQLKDQAQNQQTSTHEQVEQVSRIRQAVRELSRAGTKIHQQAQAVRGLAERSLDVTRANERAMELNQQGLRSVHEEVQGILRGIELLKEKSQSIGQAAKLIEDLSRQTDLLALNASVEAAKAQAQPVGFGALAQEVRDLAERSQRSTDEIKHLVADIQDEILRVAEVAQRGTERVNEGLAAASHFGRSLEDMADAVEQTAKASREITEASEVQHEGTEGVYDGIERIEGATDHLAANSRRTLDGADQLVEWAAALRQAIGQFVLNGQEGSAGPAAPPKNRRANHRENRHG